MKIGVFIFISVLLTVNESRCFVISMFFCMLCVKLVSFIPELFVMLFLKSRFFLLFYTCFKPCFCIPCVEFGFSSIFISAIFYMLSVEQDFLLHIYLSVLYILYADSYIWVLFHIYVSHVFCIVYVGVEFLSHTCFSHVSSCSLGK